MTTTLMLDNMEKVKAFCSLAMSKPFDIDLLSGKYVVNGKSIMGIFSLDLTKPIIMRADTEDPDFIEECSPYVFVQP